MKKIITESYAINIERLRKVIVTCKQQLLMRGKPLEKFPHYWALIPVEQKKDLRGRQDFR